METPPFRRQSPVHISRCTLAASFEFLGDRWSLLILRSALFGVRRYEDFHIELGIPRTVLADRLKRLVSAGLMVRHDYKVAGSRPRKEYVLTEMGEALRLPFLAMRQWSEHWVGQGRTPPMHLVRKTYGAGVHVAFVDEFGRIVPADDVTAGFEEWASSPISGD
ncbi:putative HxlR family transcriptional regulator [Caenibius tardaugens NBRC 16725]|uniref:Putative HxlR family transcriptional regulator n=1 Tax=Caenibius tardaugens NBRC 16725 TaxID=1219035 RepID=U2ZWJ5_9SPHN|nr:helix-turn-helix domain-containing protein [Caenibius tardaugens]AZI37702.1 transcriptional regulator [Caenibius tardaugens NBRC 16725]GAD49744.1 putative HxlR family transcriptional regulator [Caenibius tardaugens NBRC 16725]